jgi:hypothetical protein
MSSERHTKGIFFRLPPVPKQDNVGHRQAARSDGVAPTQYIVTIQARFVPNWNKVFLLMCATTMVGRRYIGRSS